MSAAGRSSSEAQPKPPKTRKSLMILLVLVVLAAGVWYGKKWRDRRAEEERFRQEMAAAAETRRLMTGLEQSLRRAEETTDLAEKIRLYDTVIADTPRIARYDEQNLRFTALMGKYQAITDKAEKIAILDQVIELCRNLDGKKDEATATMNLAILEKASLVDDIAEKNRLINQVATMEAGPGDVHIRESKAISLLQMAKSVKDKDTQLALCDKLIADYGESAEPGIQAYVATAMNFKASILDDGAERIRLLDEVVGKYRENTNAEVRVQVAWAMLRKADLIKEPVEKARIYEEVIGSYAGTADANLDEQVREAITGRVRLYTEAADKAAFVERLISEYRAKFSPARLADLMNLEAGWTEDRAGKIKLYDEIVAKYGDDVDGPAGAEAASALMSKARLADSDAEKDALYDLVFGKYQDSKNARTRRTVVWALTSKMRTGGDKAEEARLYDLIIEKYGDDTDRMVAEQVLSMVGLRSMFERDAPRTIRYYDKVIAASRDPVIRASALLGKAQSISDASEKMRLYDEVIAGTAGTDGAGGSDAATLRGYYGRALLGKARLAGDSGEKVRLYDEVIAKFKDIDSYSARNLVTEAIDAKAEVTGDNRQQVEYYDAVILKGATGFMAAVALEKKARIVQDDAEKIKIYDELIGRFDGDGQEDIVRRIVRDAMLEKAKLIDDRQEKIRLYGMVIQRSDDGDSFNSFYSVSKAFEGKIALAENKADKIRIYDEWLIRAEKDPDSSRVGRVLSEKVKLVDDTKEKIRIYDQIIAEYEKPEPKPKPGSSPLPSFRSNDRMLDALLAKAALVEDRDEKVRLYDRVINGTSAKETFLSEYRRDEALRKKGELIGDDKLLEKYYDERLRNATDEEEQASLLARKIGVTPYSERSAGNDELISRFGDSKNLKVQRLIAQAMYEKTLGMRMRESAGSSAERMKWYNTILEKFGNSTDEDVLVVVLRALNGKADAIPDKGEKLRIYNEIIAKYKDSKQYFIKQEVDEAIAAKFRLEQGD